MIIVLSSISRIFFSHMILIFRIKVKLHNIWKVKLKQYLLSSEDCHWLSVESGAILFVLFLSLIFVSPSQLLVRTTKSKLKPTIICFTANLEIRPKIPTIFHGLRPSLYLSRISALYLALVLYLSPVSQPYSSTCMWIAFRFPCKIWFIHHNRAFMTCLR